MNYLKKLLFSTFITIISLILLVFIITIFNYFNITNTKVSNILLLIIPIISLIIGGVYIGKNTVKRGFLEGIKLGIIFSLIILIINLILKENINLKDLVFYLILISSSTFGSMIGINKKS